MGKRGTALSCAASLGLFALGAAVGAHRTRRRLRQSLRPVAPLRALSSSDSLADVDANCAADCAPSSELQLDCPVCLHELVLPRVAPCGHTLCSPCLASLFEHERRPACPVCRRRIRVAADKIPVNYMIKACVDAHVAARGDQAWLAYRRLEEEARAFLVPFAPQDETVQRQSVVTQLRPAWNWFKWTVIIVTEFGAFLVSLKEVLESAPSRSRLYQRIV